MQLYYKQTNKQTNINNNNTRKHRGQYVWVGNSKGYTHFVHRPFVPTNSNKTFSPFIWLLLQIKAVHQKSNAVHQESTMGTGSRMIGTTTYDKSQANMTDMGNGGQSSGYSSNQQNVNLNKSLPVVEVA